MLVEKCTTRLDGPWDQECFAIENSRPKKQREWEAVVDGEYLGGSKIGMLAREEASLKHAAIEAVDNADVQ